MRQYATPSKTRPQTPMLNRISRYVLSTGTGAAFSGRSGKVSGA